MPRRAKRPAKAFGGAVRLFGRTVEKILSPFDRKAGLGKLAKNWLMFAVSAVAVMTVVQMRANYDMAAADTLVSDTGVGCDRLAMALVLLLPPIEELVFRIGPHKLFGKRAAFVGSIVWAMLHLMGRNFAIAGFQLVMSMFYYKLVAGGRYKESIVFHEAFNLVPLLTCFLY